jgi:hypothetical protein
MYREVLLYREIFQAKLHVPQLTSYPTIRNYQLAKITKKKEDLLSYIVCYAACAY